MLGLIMSKERDGDKIFLYVWMFCLCVCIYCAHAWSSWSSEEESPRTSVKGSWEIAGDG